MADANKALIGTWTVSFNQYRWIYVFAEGGAVTWTDPNNKRSGTGTWQETGAAVALTWKKTPGQKDATTETWNLPINPANQMGQVKADYASGWFSATKDQARFDGFAAEGQHDPFACWAACLAWYTKVSPDVPTASQDAIILSSDKSQWAPNGSITKNGLMLISVRGALLERKLIGQAELAGVVAARRFPMLIGFGSGPLGGHVNVIHGYDDATNTVAVMEPWYPDPAANKSFAYDADSGSYYNKTSGDPFKFTGAMLRRPLSYYTSKPLDGQFVVGSHIERQ
ncbi:hypothetical protein [Sphingomonas bacterium]|uniref:hypothetical protein n=1 Tax=Sphingomonas bacterium TaxID=1895847 RepID=UPI0015765303|nr:hypothetical protein [Sphingomonas bacterium]